MRTAYNDALAGGCDAAAESARVMAYFPLVKRVVCQLALQASVVMSRDDMEQIGLLAVLDAMRRYGLPDESFSAYAMKRVRGAILDELRRQDWRPRTMRQASHRRRDAVRELTRQLGREPTQAELCEALGSTEEQQHAALMAEYAETMASFDELLHGSGLMGLDDLVDHRSPEAQVMLRQSLVHALQTLDPREQRIVQLYYEFDLNLKEIAEVLALTEARVCQINKKALMKMRAALEAA